MFKLIDGRAYCYQWDTGQKVTMDGLAPGMQVHFSHLSDNDPNALVVVAKEEDGIVCADVPNILLQTAGIMKIYGYITDGSAGYTKTYSPLHVAARAKPADYVYTETETLTYQALEDRIDKLEENGGVNVTGAQVGQTIKVSEIDENGKPTAWEAVDFPKQMQPDWNQSDSTAADYVKNRTHYEQEVSVDISGTEYGPFQVGSNQDPTTHHFLCDHNLELPFELGQIWNIIFTSMGYATDYNVYKYGDNPDVEVMLDESGQLYIGTPNASEYHPFYITQNRAVLNYHWVRGYDIRYIKFVCVSGSIHQKELVKLDEKFIPESIVADWNESDETKLSYIKNRPFYEENTECFIEWDGDATGKVSVKDVLYKVSDITPSKNELIGAVVSIYNGETLTVSESDIFDLSYLGYAIGELVAVIRNAGDFNGITIPEPGLYFLRDGDIYAASLSYTAKNIKQLDEKYIPDHVRKMCVNFFEDNSGNFTADHTFDEIKAHVDNGGIVDAVIYGDTYISLISNYPDSISFFANYLENTEFIYVRINSDNKVYLDLISFDEVFVFKNQGGENSGKFLMVGSDGIVAPSDMIIQSSTEGSDKKFKITVDDNGTISATEVTA